MAGEVERLEASAVNLTTEVGSIEALLETLSAILRENANNPPRILAVADQLDENKARLAAAALAHTPSDPNAPPSAGRR